MMEVPLGDTYYVKFTTRAFATGAPTTLAGTPVISVYEEANLTQITAGVTLTADFDSVTGLNHVAIVATSGNGYAAGEYYSVVITTGTVGGVSVVGEVVGHFRVVEAENTAGRPLSEAAALGAGVITNASLAGNMEVVFETDFATNYNTTRNAWATNVQDTVGTGTLGLNDLSAADVNAEVDTALADVNLDHLVGTATGIPALPAGTYFDQMLDDGTATYDRTTDSLQAIRDRGDAAWTTGGGGSITQILNVTPMIPPAIDLANTADYRIGLSLINSVDDLPSTAEITPGTISIWRKAIGATSWTIVVNAAACSESAGQIYYDEVFDSATGYQEGDMLRFRFFSQSITADANTYEISDATGLTFYSGILSATPDVNVAQISGDSVAADNLELMYDGTGYTADTAPSSRAQVDGIGAASGGSLNFPATEDNTGGAIIGGITFVGTVDSGTFASTEQADGTPIQISDTANDIDYVIGFDVGGGRTATGVQMTVNVNGNTDEMVAQVYDHVGADWETLGTLSGAGGTSYVAYDFALFSKHTGTGAELGRVYIRFETLSTTPELLQVDQCIVAAVNIGQSVGYSQGRIFIDTNASNTNTESFVDGVADNPVSTIAAANTLNSALNLDQFYVRAGSSITFAASQTTQTFFGEGWTLALGGQDVSSSHFYEAIVSGTGTTASGNPDWHTSEIGTATIGPSDFHECGFAATFTAGAAGDYFLINCYSEVAGSGSPALNFNGNGPSSTINVRNWHGGGTWVFDSNCTASIEVAQGGGHTITTGGGDIEFRGLCRSITVTSSGTSTTQIIATTGPITINGTGGTVNIYGAHSGVTDNSGGSVTINDDAIENSAFTFTVAGSVDANIQYINDAEVIGDGNATPWDGA